MLAQSGKSNEARQPSRRRLPLLHRLERAVGALMLIAMVAPFAACTSPDDSRGVRRAASILERKLLAGRLEPTLAALQDQAAEKKKPRAMRVAGLFLHSSKDA